MKKIGWIIVGIFILFVIVGCASTKLKDATGEIQLIEHKGSAWGTGLPSWISTVTEKSSDQKSLEKALGLKNKKIWILQKKGENLDFLKAWVDQVDARADIAASVNQVVRDIILAQQFGTKEEMEQEVKQYSGRFAETALNGLVRETDWWSRTRQLPVGAEEYTTQYNYMVIYSMDEDLFEKHIKDAYEDSENEVLMKEILSKLMEEVIIDVQ